MFQLSLASLRRHPARFIATALAIVIATGFLAGALILRDSLGAALQINAESQFAGVDAVISREPEIDFGFAGGGPGGDGVQVELVPSSVLDDVRELPEVAAAEGFLSGPMSVLGDEGPIRGDLGGGNVWLTDAALNPFGLVEGVGPSQPGEVAIDRATAVAGDIEVGDEVQLSTPVGAARATVVGITVFGDRDSELGGGDVQIVASEAFRLFAADGDGFQEIRIRASGTEVELIEALATVVPGDFDVRGGDAVRESEGGDAAGIATGIGVGLQVFAYLAIIVGGLIIYNTFAAIVGQRTREFALLRAIGASPRQVRRAVRIEAFLLGLVASVACVGLGALLYVLIADSVPAYRTYVGSGSETLVITRGAVIQVLLTGVLVSVFSAIIPAFRAGRARPIEALAASQIDSGGTSKLRTVAGVVLLTLGVVGLVWGTASAPPLVAAGGALCLFVGAVVGGPVLARLVVAAISPIAKRMSATGKLAVANVGRNPTRTAATANALVVGVSLVVFTTAAGGSVRDFATDQIAQLTGADLQVIATLNDPLRPELIEAVREVDGVGAVVAFAGVIGQVPAQQDNGPFGEAPPDPVGAADFTGLSDVSGMRDEAGERVDTLDDEGLLIIDFYAQGTDLGVGDELEVTFVDGETETLAIVGVVPFSIDLSAPIIVSPTVAARHGGLNATSLLIGADLQSGEDINDIVRRVENVAFGFSGVTVIAGNFIADLISSVFNVIISGINGLLAIAVVIALFGIVNTLVLAIVERTREIGVLRAVGMTRRQLQATVRTESIIVSLFGTALGIAFGLFSAWAVTRPLFREVGSGSLTWPVQEVGVIVVIGLLIGVLASVLPAWRASRLNVLDAIRTG